MGAADHPCHSWERTRACISKLESHLVVVVDKPDDDGVERDFLILQCMTIIQKKENGTKTQTLKGRS